MNKKVKILTILSGGDIKTFAQICEEFEKIDQNVRFPFLKTITKVVKAIDDWPRSHEFWIQEDLNTLCKSNLVEKIGDGKCYKITILGLRRMALE